MWQFQQVYNHEKVLSKYAGQVTHFLNTTLFERRRGRIFFMAYLAMLHLLVFFSVTYLQSKCSGSYHHSKRGLGHAHHFEEIAARLNANAKPPATAKTQVGVGQRRLLNFFSDQHTEYAWAVPSGGGRSEAVPGDAPAAARRGPS